MGIINAGGVIEGFVPNLGRSTVELCDFRNRLVIELLIPGYSLMLPLIPAVLF